MARRLTPDCPGSGGEPTEAFGNLTGADGRCPHCGKYIGMRRGLLYTHGATHSAWARRKDRWVVAGRPRLPYRFWAAVPAYDDETMTAYAKWVELAKAVGAEEALGLISNEPGGKQ